jgi:hypothetical protein
LYSLSNINEKQARLPFRQNKRRKYKEVGGGTRFFWEADCFFSLLQVVVMLHQALSMKILTLMPSTYNTTLPKV